MKRDKSAFDRTFVMTRPGDQLIGDFYLAALACEGGIKPLHDPVSDQYPRLYPDPDSVCDLPAEAAVDALDDEDALESGDLAGWPALIAGLYQ